MIESYWWTMTGLWVVLLTVFVQNFVAAAAHGKSRHAVPGKLDDDLSHESFVFRSHRTFHNSLENLSVFVLPALLAVFVGVDAAMLAALVWTYALARLIHMVLYYMIATEKNPSPRSYFFLAGWLATAALYVVVAMQLF